MRTRITSVTVNGRVKPITSRYEYRFGEWVPIPAANVWSANPEPCRSVTKVGAQRRERLNELKEYAAEHYPEKFEKIFKSGRMYKKAVAQ